MTPSKHFQTEANFRFMKKVQDLISALALSVLLPCRVQETLYIFLGLNISSLRVFENFSCGGDINNIQKFCAAEIINCILGRIFLLFAFNMVQLQE